MSACSRSMTPHLVRRSVGAFLMFVLVLLTSGRMAAQSNSLDFGSVQSGLATPPTGTVTLTFTAAGQIGSIQPTGDFWNAGGGSCTLNATYQANDQCTVKVGFSPAAPGRRLGSVQLLASDGAVLAVGHLSGFGLVPAARFIPSATYLTGLDTQREVLGLGEAYLKAKGMALDNGGNLLISDTANSRVMRLAAGTGDTTWGTVNYSSTRSYVGSTGSFTSPEGLAVDGAGNVYVVDSNAVKMIVATSGYVSSTSPVVTVGTGFIAIHHVAVDGKGNVFVADTGANAVKEIKANANGVVNATSATVTLPATGLISPYGIALDKNGAIFVSDNAGVKKLASSSAVTPVLIASAFGSNSGGLAFDSKGNLFVGDTTLNEGSVLGTTLVYLVADTNGEIVVGATTKGIYYTGGSPSPDVAVSGSGEIYILNQLQLAFSGATYNIAAQAEVISFGRAQTLDFSGTAILDGQRSNALSVSLYNSGTAPLVFTTPSSGTNPGFTTYFTPDTSSATTCPVQSPSSSASTLAAGVTCNYSVKFSPVAPADGSITGTMTIQDNASPASQYISLKGVAAAPQPQILSFLTPPAATIHVGGNPGSTIRVAVTDYAGNVAFYATGYITITLTGTGISTPVTLNSNWLSDGVANFDLSAYTRNVEGTFYYNATLTSGNHKGTALTLTPVSSWENVLGSSTSVGSLSTGQTSGTQQATLIFDTTSKLSSIQVLTMGAPNQDYAFAAGGSCAVNTIYQAGQTCTVNYTFTPKYPGRRNGAIVLLGPGGETIGQIYLTGTGTGGQASFTPGLMTTVAGNGSEGASGDGDLASLAKLVTPNGIVVDGAGNLYIADSNNNKIRRVDASTKVITTVAGSGVAGFSGDAAAATAAQLSYPTNLALDGAGNLYIADMGNNRIRRVDAHTGVITTVAGSATAGFSGDGGLATSAALKVPIGVALDGAGNLYIGDTGNYRVRRVDANTKVITTVAGSGATGFSGDNGTATSAYLNDPEGVALDDAGNLFIADMSNHRIRRVDASTKIITTVAGSGSAGYEGDNGPAGSAKLESPTGVAVDAAGDLYIADTLNHAIRRVDASSKVITTVAGSGSAGYAGDNGPANAAKLNQPMSLSLDGAGNLFVADAVNNVIRKVTASAAPLDFGSVLQGASSSVQTVNMLNNGNAALSFPVPATGKNPSLSSYFTLDSSGASACPLLTTSSASAATLSAGTVCSLPITFAPDASADGLVGGSLIVTDDGPTTTQSIALGGVATPPIPASVTAAVNASASYSPNAQNVTLSATVTSTGGQVNEGSITFTVKDGATLVGVATNSATVDAGSASVSYSLPAATAPKVYTIQAVYNQAASTPKFQASSDATHTLTVSKAAQTITVTTPAPSSAAWDTSFTVAASSASGLPITYSATGGCSNVGPVFKMTSSTQTCVVSIGQAGDSLYSTATTVVASVAALPATPTLGVGNLPANAVNGGSFSPVLTNSGTGTTSLLSSTPTVCSVDNGVVHYLGAGVCSLTLTTTASGDYGATSKTLTFVIAKATSTVAIASSSNPSLAMNAVAFAAHVSSTAGMPTGVVSFLDGAAVLGSANLNAGVATFSSSSLTVGSHAITAIYQGDTNFSGATSGSLAQSVIDFAVSAPVPDGSGGGSGSGSGSGSSGGTSQTVQPGGTALYSVQIVPTTGASFSVPATLTLSGLPAGSTVTLTPTNWVQQAGNTWTLPANTPLSAVNISIQTPSYSMNLNAANTSPGNRPSFLWALLLLPFAGKLRRFGKQLNRTVALMLLFLAGAAVLAGVSGCGSGNGYYAQSKKTYTVTATVTAGSLSHSTDLTLTVE